MLRHVGRTDQSLINQILDLGMILGGADQASLPKQIKTRIAGMRPISMACLHDDGDARRPRRLQHRKLVRVRAERCVRAEHRLLQKLEWVAQDGLGFLLEPLDEKPHSDLRGDFAAGVTPHSISDDQQQRVASVGIGEPVLIDLPRALARILKNRETHTYGTKTSVLRSAGSARYALISEKRRRLMLPSSVSLRFLGGMSRIALCNAKTLCGRSKGSRRKHQSITSSRLSEYCPDQMRFAGTRWSS